MQTVPLPSAGVFFYARKKMPANFGNYETDTPWSPNYGDIDWRQRVAQLETRGDLDTYRPVGFDSGDGLVQECTQENLIFRTNEVDPDMDMAAVGDPRDGKDYIWFREDNPERFESLIRNMGHAALSIHSRYPLPDTVTVYLDRRSTGIDTRFLEERE